MLVSCVYEALILLSIHIVYSQAMLHIEDCYTQQCLIVVPTPALPAEYRLE